MTDLQTPDITNFVITLLYNWRVFSGVANLDLQPPLVCKMQKTDETKASADLVHLVPGVRAPEI
jgi:hypothetical protein